MAAPVIQYKDAKGYRYNETADWWKTVCRELPCFAALQWPDYATKVINTKIDGKPVVIQLWKGWCQRFAGSDKFPGGIGAEVGIYHKVRGKARPSALKFLPAPIATFVLNVMGRDSIWWPFPELNTKVEFTLVNPVTKKTFFTAGPENSYWLNKWMYQSSYAKYRRAQGKRWPHLPAWLPGNSKTPLWAVGYELHYKINGKNYPSW